MRTHPTKTRAIDTEDLHQSTADGGKNTEEANKGLTPPVDGLGTGASVGPCKAPKSVPFLNVPEYLLGPR